MEDNIDIEKLLCKVLQTEINKTIDDEIIKAVKDPTYTPDITPIKFESEEDEEAFRRMVKRNLEG
jgi:hypothetical protein